MWLTILSDQLPVLALVGRYLTNKLIGRGLIPKRQVPKDPHLWIAPHARDDHIRYYPTFQQAIPNLGANCPRVTHPFAALTRMLHPEDLLSGSRSTCMPNPRRQRSF